MKIEHRKNNFETESKRGSKLLCIGCSCCCSCCVGMIANTVVGFKTKSKWLIILGLFLLGLLLDLIGFLSALPLLMSKQPLFFILYVIATIALAIFLYKKITLKNEEKG